MPSTFSVSSSVELAVVERNGFVESRHAGSLTVLDPAGEVRASLGDPDAPILPRSALKPLQAIASVTAGAALADEKLAIATASHAGTPQHVALVREVLGDAGLTEDALACPPSWPSDGASKNELLLAGKHPSRVCMTCSGKHAAMLTASVAAGWSIEGYLEHSHPLQAHIRDVVERFTGERIAASAVDGCGAPVYAVSLAGLAKAMHRIGTASEKSPFAMHRTAGALIRAAREHPWAVEGKGRTDTTLIERLGVFAKFGAEGVMVVIAPDGTTVVVKVLDGSGRAGAVIALRALVAVGALDEQAVTETERHLHLEVWGGGQPVGQVSAQFSI